MTTEEMREAIIAEARSWLKTPYHHCQRVKGVGVDCIQLLIASYVAAGVVEGDIKTGYYPSDWHLHRNVERYLDGMRSKLHQTDTAKKGDIALFRFGRTVSHGAIVLDASYVIHAYVHLGCVISALTDVELAGRLHSYWTFEGAE